MSVSSKHNYVLKDRENEELLRLDFQHQVWLEESAIFCKKARFGIGQKLIDLGCGPGYFSYDLSKIVGPEGQIFAVDNSLRFIDYIQNKINEEGYKNITPVVADIQTFKPTLEIVDGAVARWVLMFLKDPDAAVERISHIIKPNGTFAVWEYYQFRSISLWPESKSFSNIYDAVYKLIRDHGGDPDIGVRIPGILARHGFKILDIYPILRLGRPGSSLWQWLEIINKNHINLVEGKFISEEALSEYYQDWSEHSKDPNAFITAPPVLCTIGIKDGNE